MQTQHIKLKSGTALGDWGRGLPILLFELPYYLTSPEASQVFTEVAEDCCNPILSFHSWGTKAKGVDAIY